MPYARVSAMPQPSGVAGGPSDPYVRGNKPRGITIQVRSLLPIIRSCVLSVCSSRRVDSTEVGDRRGEVVFHYFAKIM